MIPEKVFHQILALDHAWHVILFDKFHAVSWLCQKNPKAWAAGEEECLVE
jgi:hypothetical protein